jgi:hypothetical protein
MLSHDQFAYLTILEPEGLKVVLFYGAFQIFIAGRLNYKCAITARQYGEVVLHDASTGQDSVALAGKLSRCKEGLAHILPYVYKL